MILQFKKGLLLLTHFDSLTLTKKQAGYLSTAIQSTGVNASVNGTLTMQKTDNKTKDQLQQVLTSLQTHSPSTTTTNSEPEKTEVVFSQKEQDATRYLFMRMNGVYGKAKMLSLYDTHTALQQARRQYAKSIGKYDREQID